MGLKGRGFQGCLWRKITDLCGFLTNTFMWTLSIFVLQFISPRNVDRPQIGSNQEFMIHAMHQESLLCSNSPNKQVLPKGYAEEFELGAGIISQLPCIFRLRVADPPPCATPH